MRPASQHHPLAIACPACPDVGVPLALIEACQRLLDEHGPCTGIASYECPALYFASLAAPAPPPRRG